ncbi:hypothetical protein DFJ77DRAFT_480713 [Powellomyces hirtus]|nr:hypothetical protein DFJ77DRAFT_480713 [Powellomyces hirtus]
MAVSPLLAFTSVLLAWFHSEIKTNRRQKQPPSAHRQRQQDHSKMFIPTGHRNGLLERSDAFIPSFPTSMNRIRVVDPKLAHTAVHALTACVVVHPRLPGLFDAYLKLKREEGNAVEKAVYADVQTWQQLAVRLITKRPVVFCGSNESTVLRGVQPDDAVNRVGHREWAKVGTEEEIAGLRMCHYLSYDEMSLSALLGASTRTLFINSGTRDNRGKAQDASLHEFSGVYVGLVGARYEIPGQMEWSYTVGEPIHRTSHMRKLWDEFFGPCELDGKSVNEKRYKQRIKITLESLFLEAERRAKDARKKAYVHVVGLGLGVWAVSDKQAPWLVEAAMEALDELELPNIAVVDFSYFSLECASLNIARTSNQHIRIKFSNRNPADKLVGEDEGLLLVASFAWDANSYVGNEYFAGRLTASGDPAAACCSTISELLNPEINPDFPQRVVLL